MKKKYINTTLKKALDILEVFLNQKGEIGLVQLSKLSGFNISTTYRIASGLVERDYLRQEQKRGKYSLGVKFLEFGSIAKSSVKITDIAMLFMEDLNKLCGESVNLAILDSNVAVYVAHIESSHTLRTFTQIGNRVPLYCTGVGKVMLAHMAEEARERYFDSISLISYTNNTITDLNQLKKQLKVIKKEDIAFDDEEMDSGVKCVASPVRYWDGNVIASISISGPSTRLTRKRVKELLTLTKNGALKISRAIGYIG